jgi:hypothetical protein
MRLTQARPKSTVNTSASPQGWPSSWNIASECAERSTKTGVVLTDLEIVNTPSSITFFSWIERATSTSLNRVRTRHLSASVGDRGAGHGQESCTFQPFGAAYFRHRGLVEIRRAVSFLVWDCCPLFQTTLCTHSYRPLLTMVEGIRDGGRDQRREEHQRALL